MTEPSKVIHIRNVGHEISENDLLQLVHPFGGVSKLVVLRAKNQTLIQMQDMASAVSMLQYYSNVQPIVRGRNVYIQFSSHQELTTMEQNTQARTGDQDVQSNRILLVSIHHMLYPITVEVLHQVFSPHGFVEKIVTFQKSAGFQALIQYHTRQSATSALIALQGRNIYDGCCQLDFQFSNLAELQVNYKNDRSRDFTNPLLPTEQKGRSSQVPLRNRTSHFQQRHITLGMVILQAYTDFNHMEVVQPLTYRLSDDADCQKKRLLKLWSASMLPP